MSKIMEDLSVYDSKFKFVTEDKPKVAEMTKGKSRIPGRKALANISNMQQGFTSFKQDHKLGPNSNVSRKHIEQLQKEITVLMKHLAEKNKVIELSGIEMQKLRVTLEKVKQQNLQLAQSNTQFVAEINAVKEKQKVLNHELRCKNGLIIAKNLELEEKNKTRMCQANDSDNNKVVEPEEIEICTEVEGDDDNHYTNSRKIISQSSVHSNQIIQDNDKIKSKRIQTRSESAKFKLDDVPPCSFPDNDIDDGDDKMKENDSNAETSLSSSLSSAKKEVAEGDDSLQENNKHQEHRKSLRPVREAAKKVQSYKEVNLVVKMRRE